MNLLVTGGGTSGSWSIRGLQLGKAIGADVVPRALDVAAYDVAVVVKRAPADVIERIHKAGVPLVWDPLDAWPQPDGNSWSRGDCVGWLAGIVRQVRPDAIVAATQAMADDCAAFGVPVLALPHHYRPGLARTPMRQIRAIGYEGEIRHLGAWRPFLERECSRRGWRFVVNPASITELDIVIALRERDGYAPRHWKSNVKLANAQGSGTPVICSPEAGYLETNRAGAMFASTEAETLACLDMLEPLDRRALIAESLFADRIPLDRVAQQYRAWLCSLAPNC